MKENTRKIVSYALSISMLFNAATVNQNKKVDVALLPNEACIEQPEEDKREKQKKLK